MRFFPPLVRSSPVWVARMRTLEGAELLEDDQTTLFMTYYLLSLDEKYDRQATDLRKCIRRAEDAEKQTKALKCNLRRLRHKQLEWRVVRLQQLKPSSKSKASTLNS